MARLIHSSSAAIRALQISSIQVFAFVEGGLDRPFAEKILGACGLKNNQFRVFSIKEVNGGTGGKPAVLTHFREFRRLGKLYENAWEKKYVSIFFVDKDADDFLGTKLRSPHLIYTPTYDLEGVLFHFGNVLKALTEACLITTMQAIDVLGDVNLWIKRIAVNWVDWITLCLISQKNNKNTGYTFDRFSYINPDPLKGPAEDKLLQCKERSASVLGMTMCDFELYYQSVRRRVELSINSGGCLKYFRGKWIKSIIQAAIEAAPKIDDASINGVGDKMNTALLAQVATSENCDYCKHYRPILDEVLVKVR